MMASEEALKRDEFIKGLRELADWLENNPVAPLASYGSLVEEDVGVFGVSRIQLEALARSDDGTLVELADGTYRGLQREFSGGVRYSVQGKAADVGNDRLLHDKS